MPVSKAAVGGDWAAGIRASFARFEREFFQAVRRFSTFSRPGVSTTQKNKNSVDGISDFLRVHLVIGFHIFPKKLEQASHRSAGAVLAPISTSFVVIAGGSGIAI